MSAKLAQRYESSERVYLLEAIRFQHRRASCASSSCAHFVAGLARSCAYARHVMTLPINGSCRRSCHTVL